MGLLAETALLLCYFLPFDTPMVHRLSLPVHLLLAVAVVLAGARLWGRRAGGWKVLAGAVCGRCVVQGLPAMATQAYTRDYSPGLEMSVAPRVPATVSRARLPLHRPGLAVLDRQQSVRHAARAGAAAPGQPRLAPAQPRLHRDVCVSAVQGGRPDRRAPRLDPADDLGPDFEELREPVWERRIEILVIDRISRVTAIHDRRRGDRPADPLGGAATARTAPARNWRGEGSNTSSTGSVNSLRPDRRPRFPAEAARPARGGSAAAADFVRPGGGCGGGVWFCLGARPSVGAGFCVRRCGCVGVAACFVGSCGRVRVAPGLGGAARPPSDPGECRRAARLIAGCTLVAVLTVPYGYKVLYDEVVLPDTAWTMHFFREVGTLVHAYRMEGMFAPVAT